MWNNINHKKNEEWNLAICPNIDVPIRYYDNWNKSDRKRQILYGITFMWNLKQNKTNKKQNKQTNITKEKVKIHRISSWLPEGLEEEKEGKKCRRIGTELQ